MTLSSVHMVGAHAYLLWRPYRGKGYVFWKITQVNMAPVTRITNFGHLCHRELIWVGPALRNSTNYGYTRGAIYYVSCAVRVTGDSMSRLQTY